MNLNHEINHEKSRGTVFLIAVIISVTAGQFALLFYLPALPLIGHDMHLHGGQIEVTVVTFLYGFGISQLIYGNLSDSFGRKRILLIGVVILACGVFLTYSSYTYNMLLVSRLIQGLGAGAIAIIPRAIMKDSYEGTKFIKENDANSFLITLRENFYRRCQESVKEISSDPILHSVFKKDFFGKFFSTKKWIKKLDSVRGVD